MFFSILLSITLSIGLFSQSFANINVNTTTNLIITDTCKLNPYRDFNYWVNHLVFHHTRLTPLSNTLTHYLGPDIGYYTQCYLRDVIVGSSMYWTIAGGWHIYIYNVYGITLFIEKNRAFPNFNTILRQQILAQYSILYYAFLPVIGEFFIENDLTRTYYYIADMDGWGNYLWTTLLYFLLVEVSVYWIHRTLHMNKFLYKAVHAAHHQFNQINTLTPWASLAFNPIDGILQGSPYVMHLFFVPTHYFTFLILLFFTSIWAINIHDTVLLDSEPIMGAKYHTIHHTHYHYNFGQYFIFCDWLWGTLKRRV